MTICGVLKIFNLCSVEHIIFDMSLTKNKDSGTDSPGALAWCHRPPASLSCWRSREPAGAAPEGKWG